MKKTFTVIHPWSFTLLSILLLYKLFGKESPPTEMVRPWIILSVINICIFWIFYRFVKDIEVSAFLVTLFVFAFYYE
jgi:FtsH-binding integral membrane protein